MNVQIDGNEVKLLLDVGLTANHVAELNDHVAHLLPEDHKYESLVFDLCTAAPWRFRRQGRPYAHGRGKEPWPVSPS